MTDTVEIEEQFCGDTDRHDSHVWTLEVGKDLIGRPVATVEYLCTGEKS